MRDLFIKSKRAIRYLFYRHLDINEQLEIVQNLNNSKQIKLFWNMSKADRHHSYEVFKRTKKITDKENILILSLFHDIGKSNIDANWLFRILSELNIIRNKKSIAYLDHERIGYEILLNNNVSDKFLKNYKENLLLQKNKYLDKTDY